MTIAGLRAAIRTLLWAALLANFTLAYAAAQLVTVASPDALHIQWDMAALSVVISTFSGIAALLRRIDKELTNNNGVMPRPLLFSMMHLTGSWVAGFLAFIVGQIAGIDVWRQLGLLVISSYAGAAALDFAIQGLAKRVDPSIPVEKLP